MGAAALSWIPAYAGMTVLFMQRDPGVNEAQLRDFLVDSLALWRVDGSVEAAAAPVVAIIRAHRGAIVWIERAFPDTPFRWLVRWRGAGDAPGGARETRPRPCGSLVGVLNAVRGALGVDRGSAVRIAPAPNDQPVRPEPVEG